MNEDIADLPNPQALAASLLHLMTRYAESPCPNIATLIARELRFLEMTGDAAPVLLRNTAKRLFSHWVALQHCPQPCPAPQAPASLH